MLTRYRVFLALIAVCAFAAISQAQCPGYNPTSNTNLACAIATTAPAQSSAPALSTTVGATVGTQLSQLPIATAVSGAGLIFDPSIGTWRLSDDIGPILTQRGDTLGRHKILLSGTYQRFGFSSIDGIDLKKLEIVNQLVSGANTYFSDNPMRIDFRVDQFVGLATFGLTNKIDLSFIAPFSSVTLKSQRNAGSLYTVAGGNAFRTPLQDNFFPGSAHGIGDVTGGVKANIFRSKSENTSIAVGGLVRFPTGEAENYLGSGAYGIKPYMVLSHRGKRVTPNASFAYQWNGKSILFNNDNLPSSLAYTGGVDVRVVKRLSVSGEFLGQYVLDGPRLVSSSISIPGQTLTSVSQFKGSYAMNNAAVGFKTNPVRGLFISASAMFKLDDAGLRAKVVPLVGIAYRF